MKRYTVVFTFERNIKVIEDEKGLWVDAEIAQEMYDALKESRRVVQCLINDGYMGYILLRTRIDEALAKADKGETK